MTLSTTPDPTHPNVLVRQAIEASGIGVWEMDVLNNRIFWSDQCCRLFFVAPGTQLTYRDFLDLLHPDDWLRVDRVVRQAFDPAGGGHYDTEYRALDPGSSGQQRWLRATGRAFVNELGQTYRFVGTVQDISPYKEMQQRLEQALAAAK